MDGWLKALVAAACVVVIAGGGYFAWKENGAAKAAVAAEKEATMRAGCAQAKTYKASLPELYATCKERGYY